VVLPAVEAPHAALMIVSETLRVGFMTQRARELFALGPQAAPPHLSRLLTDIARSHPGWTSLCFAPSGHAMATWGTDARGKTFGLAIVAHGVELQGQAWYLLELQPLGGDAASPGGDLRAQGFEATTQGAVILDVSQAGGTVVFVNAAFEALTGLPRTALLGRGAGEFGARLGDEHAGWLSAALLRRGAGQDLLIHYRRKPTATLWLRTSIVPLESSGQGTGHYLVLYGDVTSEQEAQEQRQLAEMLVEISPDGLVMFDERLRIVLCNPAFERLTGLANADVVGHSRLWLEDRLTELANGRSPERQYVSPAFADTEPDEHAALPAVVFDRGTDLLHLRAPRECTLLRRVRYARHPHRAMVMYFRDVTRERALDRMKSEFLSTAAHELRTPIASVFGYAELLLMRDFDARKAREMLQTIHRQATVMNILINDLLDLARIETQQAEGRPLERLALQDCVRSALAEFVAPTVDGAERAVELQLPQRPAFVDADRSQLRLLINNLLSNAHKYSDPEKGVLVRIERRQSGDHWQSGIVIQDHGIGMTREQVARIFERFYRANTGGPIPGSGLGMTIVKGIVDFHKGLIEIDSRPGEGTTVKVWFPEAA
jgi:PAS domain S-box-containing protein